MIGSILKTLVSPFVEVGSTIATDWSARKTAKAASAIAISKAKQDLVITKITAKIEAAKTVANNDSAYDLQVLKNRDGSIADELLITTYIGVFIAHFVPYTQPYMNEGWRSMGYTDGPAWWFEFGMVGILVSTLGLMRMFRIMMNAGGKFNPARKSK